MLNDIKMSYNNIVHVSKFYFVCLFYEMRSPPILRVSHFFHKYSSTKTSCKTLKKIGNGTSFFQKSNYYPFMARGAGLSDFKILRTCPRNS